MFLHVQNPGKMMIMYLNKGQGLPRARAGIVSTITAHVRCAVLCRASSTTAQRKNITITNLQSVYYVQSEEDKNGTKNKSIHQDFCNQIGPKKPLQNVVKVVSDRSRK